MKKNYQQVFVIILLQNRNYFFIVITIQSSKLVLKY